MPSVDELREECKSARRVALGRAIVQRRQSARMTQGQVADLLGWSRTTLVAIESATQSTSIDQLYELADLLDYDVNDFLQYDLQIEASKIGGGIFPVDHFERQMQGGKRPPTVHPSPPDPLANRWEQMEKEGLDIDAIRKVCGPAVADSLAATSAEPVAEPAPIAEASAEMPPEVAEIFARPKKVIKRPAARSSSSSKKKATRSSSSKTIKRLAKASRKRTAATSAAKASAKSTKKAKKAKK